MIPGSANPLLLASAAAGGYQVQRSLRFNSSDSASCARTFSSGSSTTTQTLSLWVKRAKLGATGCFWSGYDGSATYGAYFQFESSDALTVILGGASLYQLTTTQVFRDPSSWYHIVLTIDTNNGTSGDRIRLYVNGSRVTTFSTASYPTSGYGCQFALGNANNKIGTTWGSSAYSFFSGYLADIHFIDGQALTPSSFTEVSATTGQLIPKAYSGGSYGTNGFYLQFADNSSNTAATLGKDTSGNSNNWTPNNLSTTTGGPTSVAAASGALPVYNTTDTYGTVKGTGTRTDTNSASIVLAVGMDGTNGGTAFTDESATIKGSGSPKSLTVNNATTSTSAPKYYGSSGNFDGVASAKYLSFSPGTDLAFGTGDFTIEAWVNMTSRTTSNNQFVFNTSGGTQIALFQGLSYGYEQPAVRIGATDVFTSTAVVTYGTWQHWAATRSGSTVRLFINGVLQGTGSDSTNVTAQTTAYVGGNGSSANSNTNGYIQDFRIYKGVAKYTGNFNPPSSTANATIAAGNDSLVDTPTSYGTDTGVGGSVRGNYCTWNPLSNGGQTLSNGNLDAQGPASWATVLASFQLPATGKWYWEVTPTTANTIIGISVAGSSLGTYIGNLSMTSYGWYGDSGNKIQGPGGTQTSYASYAANDVIGVAYDADAGTLVFYKNGTSQGTAFSSLSGSFFPALSISGTSSAAVTNFGQRAFAYPVSGFKALCDTNLPTPLVAKPNTLFDTILYSGNNSTQSITSLAFNPDMVWSKCRNVGRSHRLSDAIRGSNVDLYTDTTASDNFYGTGSITAFTANGFNLDNSASSQYNTSGETYVSWCWDAGTSTVSNTAGSITSQVRANVSAGFSVITYAGNATAGATVGHGLGVAPEFLISKSRSDTGSWLVYHKSIGNTKYLALNLTIAEQTSSDAWNNTTPSSTVFTLGGSGAQPSGITRVAYCFSPVVGYSSMGSYVGNGSADGPFCFTGFRPRFLLLKASSSTSHWHMMDTSREPYNQMDTNLFANLSNAELTDPDFRIDFLSNGFKLRTSGPSMNGSGVTYIYAAFAESPFQFSRAR